MSRQKPRGLTESTSRLADIFTTALFPDAARLCMFAYHLPTQQQHAEMQHWRLSIDQRRAVGRKSKIDAIRSRHSSLSKRATDVGRSLLTLVETRSKNCSAVTKISRDASSLTKHVFAGAMVTEWVVDRTISRTRDPPLDRSERADADTRIDTVLDDGDDVASFGSRNRDDSHLPVGGLHSGPLVLALPPNIVLLIVGACVPHSCPATRRNAFFDMSNFAPS